MSVECSTNSFLSSLRITSAPVSIRLGDQLGHADEIIRCSQESRVDAICFAPLAADFRVACTTNGSGLQRPLVWDPSSGERINLSVHDLEGELTPVDWSPNGKHLLLWQVYQALDQFYLYNIAGGLIAKLHFPFGGI